MADFRLPTPLSRALTATAAGLMVGAGVVAAPPAHADAVAYLVNVTVRPGYDFANADAALAYGNRLCDKLAQGVGYSDLMAEVKTDFHTTDEFHASYLITQAAGELCPAQIGPLRDSAAGYRPTP
ncbi:DUF732 domain-containing protein [Mycolicibacterium diernhoferi]|uniref:DUF732 domain-containing protein n=2 Tax=Mycolicibacterium diernhoferi TaxID=1801 RepID=A0A1Q4HC35_9MYCO|nr:hypothetical protein BRW64_14765 [Mycolicibacterium diernhoferi]OPE52390.1 hypothetical protein BV510_18420 [Mycolicibacterium diernhoferi]QYL23694.1 DUF732 domain-containing protein [Mycolicibacterium diernhoferi]